MVAGHADHDVKLDMTVPVLKDFAYPATAGSSIPWFPLPSTPLKLPLTPKYSTT